MFIKQQSISDPDWVKETRFGKWFLSTKVWFRYVLTEAFSDLDSLLKDKRPTAGRILDAGCGQGQAFSLLENFFEPDLIVGVDIDAELIDVAASAVNQNKCQVDVLVGSVCKLSYPDGYFNTIFAHQLLHHVPNQMEVLQELYRVLSPGGLLLSSESCREFINTFPVRLLFRHPMEAQKEAEQYIALVRSAGFQLHDSAIKTSSPWWSQRDLGLLQRLGWRNSTALIPTEVIMVAEKL